VSERALVVVTGASGRVGRALVPGLRERYALRLHARSSGLADVAAPGDETVTGDIEGLDTARSIVEGATAVVHLAGQSRADASWEQVLGPNIIGTRSILEACRLEQVPRVILASSNHVTGQYDLARDWPIGARREIAPDGVYGVSKAFGEALGSWYAWAHGLTVICLRIGWVLEKPHDEKSERLWLSPRDLVQLVDRCLQADVRFGIYHGVSGHVPGRYDLADARTDLGYDPQDARGS
jgi:nucleoside-diphosphate-sugar epimerase